MIFTSSSLLALRKNAPELHVGVISITSMKRKKGEGGTLLTFRVMFTDFHMVVYLRIFRQLAHNGSVIYLFCADLQNWSLSARHTTGGSGNGHLGNKQWSKMERKEEKWKSVRAINQKYDSYNKSSFWGKRKGKWKASRYKLCRSMCSWER